MVTSRARTSSRVGRSWTAGGWREGVAAVVARFREAQFVSLRTRHVGTRWKMRGGADAVPVINTIPGRRGPAERKCFCAGATGPAIKPVA